MPWIAIHLPDLPLQAFSRADPERTPLVVCAAGARRVVLAANAAALDCGIAPGCSLASALALAPGLKVRERSPKAEAALLTELASWALQFSPQVSLDPPCGVVLDVTASLRLFGGIEALLARVRHGTRALGLDCHACSAPTPLAACWLARGARFVSRFVDHPVDQISTAALPAALAPLPLEAVLDDPASRKFFEHLGCRTLGDCFTLPRNGLAQRGHQTFLHQLDQALGRLPDPRRPWVPPPVFHARVELPCPMARSDALLFGARRLLSALSGALGAQQRSIERFTLRLEHEDQPPTVLEIHLGSACRDEARFTLLTREHLNACILPGPAMAITLDAADWLELNGTQHTLFADASEQASARAVLIARLAARLGEEAISQLDVRQDHRPECSTANVRPTTSTPAPQPPHLMRPLWLLEHPRPLGEAEPPWTRHKLECISGPERIEAGWWDDHPVARDYYIARDRHGALLWVFQSLAPPHHWFVHGLFS